MNRLKRLTRFLRRDAGSRRQHRFADLEEDELATLEAVRHYTMTSDERIVALTQAVDYVERTGVSGAIVECGVWRGGSMMAVARTLLSRGNANRDLFLFDTFEGMSAPTEMIATIMGPRPPTCWSAALVATRFGATRMSRTCART